MSDNPDLNREQVHVLAHLDGMLLGMLLSMEQRDREAGLLTGVAELRARFHRAFPFLDEITDDIDALRRSVRA
jgi:hypothetical protein